MKRPNPLSKSKLPIRLDSNFSVGSPQGLREGGRSRPETDKAKKQVHGKYISSPCKLQWYFAPEMMLFLGGCVHITKLSALNRT